MVQVNQQYEKATLIHIWKTYDAAAKAKSSYGTATQKE